MEAFALLQIEKKKKRLQKQEAEEKAQLLEIEKAKSKFKENNQVAADALNLSLGYTIPPHSVFAVGRPASAAVWWGCAVDDKSIFGWEIHRYRKDIGEWNYKGFELVDLDELHGKNQFIVKNLTDNKEYKFSVKAVNPQGNLIIMIYW